MTVRHLPALLLTVLLSSLLALTVQSAAPPADLLVEVRAPLRHDRSSPLRTLRPPPPVRGAALPARPLPPPAAVPTGEDPLWQREFGPGRMPAPLAQWEGTGNVNGVLPPDPVVAVGPAHVVQWVNLSFQIWTRDGTPLLGPLAGNLLWEGFGGLCESSNQGDPVVRYDHLADRWVMTQFAVRFPTEFHQCVAVSASGDPAGAWYRYDYLVSRQKFNDYPKLALWPESYTLTVNQFEGSGGGWAGVGVLALERARMLRGEAARMLYIDLGASAPEYSGLLPADLDGPPPPAGTPALFAAISQDWQGVGARLHLWKLSLSWNRPEEAFLERHADLEVAPFDGTFQSGRADIPQPEAERALDALADRLMFRLQYRRFADHAALIASHTVDVSGQGHAGVRWYEVRDPLDAPRLHQQGSYAPDEHHRWMGSAAMDGSGNLAIGYSVSSATLHPSIRYTGRLAGDPPGLLPQGEGSLVEGGGSQLSVSGRWGDYSTLVVDPLDDCTFWYTAQYYAQTTLAEWRTAIGAFRFPTCTTGPRGDLVGTVRAASGDPLARVEVRLGPLTTLTDEAGHYQFRSVASGAYALRAERYGYLPYPTVPVEIPDGGVTQREIVLTPRAPARLTGTVRDGTAQGWPLYARIQIRAPLYDAPPIFSDPLTGRFSVPLASGVVHEITVTPVDPSYGPLVRPLLLAPDEHRLLPLQPLVDRRACTAAGYGVVVDGLHESFEHESESPPGWQVVDRAGSGQVWRFDDPGQRGNLTGGRGGFAILDSDFFIRGQQDSELVSPVVDLSALEEVTLQFSSDFRWWSGGGDEVARVELSAGAGAGWTTVWEQRGEARRGPDLVTLDVSDLVAGRPAVRLRFHYSGGRWEWWWQVDDVALGRIRCLPRPGGLLIGHVRDANDDRPVSGAELRLDEVPVVSVATPNDPQREDGYFSLFVPAGDQRLELSAPGYGTVEQPVTVPVGTVIERSLLLPAGRLELSPDTVTLRLAGGSSRTLPLTLTNSGSLSTTFQIEALPLPPPSAAPIGPFAAAHRHVSPKRLDTRTSEGDDLPPPPPAPAWPTLRRAGRIDSAPAQWGGAFDSRRGWFWLSDNGAGRAPRLLPLTPDGTPAGAAIPLPDGGFLADVAYDPGRDELWVVRVGGAGCIESVSPASGRPTGRRICPSTGQSQRGLAFDPVSESFYSGSWTDGILYHFDRAGTLLDSQDIGIAISGLSFHAGDRTLIVLANRGAGTDLYRLDPTPPFRLLGGSTTALEPWTQGGLALDCDGGLWAVGQQGRSMRLSGLPAGGCAPATADWLHVGPAGGTLEAGNQRPLTVTIDAARLPGGPHQAHLRVAGSTPYDDLRLPVTVHVEDHRLEAPPPPPVPPGTRVEIQVTLTNHYPTTEPFLLTARGEGVGGWSGEVTLSPDEAVVRSVEVSIPPTALDGAVTPVALSAVAPGRGDRTQTLELRLTTRWPRYRLPLFHLD